MRSRMTVFTTVVLTSVLILPSQSFAASPKAGSACKLLNQVIVSAGFKFTCVKSGKKTVWSKGVKITDSSSASGQKTNNDKSNSNDSNSQNATLGEPCPAKDQMASIPNGTAICSSVNNKLIWQKWMPSNESGNSGSNNNGGSVTLGSTCQKKGDTGPIPNGTAVCASSSGKLIWINISSQPVPSDGVWIYMGDGTDKWNTDLPPDAWTGEPSWFNSSWDIPTSFPVLPLCTSSSILTNYITDLDQLSSITPQGFMQPGSHALPVPHMYYNAPASTDKDPNGVAYRTKLLNMFAPADMTLYSAAKLTYTMADGYQYSEWMMTWHFCGTFWMFNAHVGWIAPEVQAAIDAAPVKNCQTGGQLNTKSTDCYYSRFAYRIKAGTLYAKSSGRAHGFDFGFTDASAPNPQRINPKVFAPRWAAGGCHINYYSSDMRGKLEAKLIGNNGCGQLVSDKEGSAQGVWLAIGQNKYSVLEDYHLALVKHWSDRDLQVFSIGWNAEIPGLSGGVFAFKPNTSGPSNKSFADVKSGETMCYENLSGSGRNGEAAPTLFIKITSTGTTETLVIAKGSVNCGSGPYSMPTGSQTFERKLKS